MLNTRVIIVGGGVAGIAAASRLIENGMNNITILEAEDRLGGRVHTTPFGESFVDLGAHWVHGEEDNSVYKIAAPLDLVESSRDIENLHYVYSDGTEIPQDIGTRLFERCAMILNDEEALKTAKGSVAEYVSERFKEVCEDAGLSPEEEKAFLDWNMKYECSIEGCDSLWEASALGLINYKQCLGDPTLCWKTGGFSNILDLLMGKLLGKEWIGDEIEKKIELNKEVVEINWFDEDKVKIRCSDGSRYFADHAIITISLGVLKDISHSLFKPSLPEPNATAIQGLGIGTVDKIYFYFGKEWWPPGVGFGFLYREEELKKQSDELDWAKGIIGFYAEKNSPGVLGAWIVGDCAQEMEQTSDKIVKETCVSLLRRFLGKTYNIPDPLAMIRSNWYRNRHFRGSYSFRSISTMELQTSASDLAQPLTNSGGNQVVFFAGEATHDHFYSTVHGAMETGWREADKIINLQANINNRKEVVIIGAGLAGLTAATTLIKGGITNIVILEAQSVPGGRVRSIKVNDGYVELGAQWLHGSHSSLCKMAKEANLISNLYSEEGAGPYYRENGEEIPPMIVHEVANEVNKALGELEKFCSDSGPAPPSVGHFLDEQFTAYLDKCGDPPNIREIKKELYNWHIRFQVIDNSCTDLYKLSAKAWGIYEFCGGQDYINFKHGSISLIEVLVNELPPTTLRLNCPVSEVHWSEEVENQSVPTCRIKCRDGTEFTTNHVIVTPSVGFLKNNQNFFRPKLPSIYIQALNRIGFDVINKVFLEYEKPWWEKDLKGIQLVWNMADPDINDLEDGWTRGLSGFDRLVNLPNVLVGWVGGQAARLLEDIPPNNLGKHCTALFKKFTSRPDIPQPSRVIRSQWGKNVFVGGGYSHIKKAAQVEGIEVPEVLLKPIFTKLHSSELKIPTILFAGEALHKTHYSTMHGAHESGKIQAMVLLHHLKK